MKRNLMIDIFEIDESFSISEKETNIPIDSNDISMIHQRRSIDPNETLREKTNCVEIKNFLPIKSTGIVSSSCVSAYPKGLVFISKNERVGMFLKIKAQVLLKDKK